MPIVVTHSHVPNITLESDWASWCDVAPVSSRFFLKFVRTRWRRIKTINIISI